MSKKLPELQRAPRPARGPKKEPTNYPATEQSKIPKAAAESSLKSAKMIDVREAPNTAETAVETEGESEGLDDRHKQVARIISSAAKWSVASAAIPLPWVDLAALAGVQTKMISDISDQYGQKPSREVVRGAVFVFLGTLIPSSATGVLLSSGMKLAPGLGWIIGMASVATLGAAATYAIGKIFVRHFEAGGTLNSFNPDEVKKDLKAEFSKSRSKAASKSAA
jgi:uncharacterized protein (DUF697 family)